MPTLKFSGLERILYFWNYKVAQNFTSLLVILIRFCSPCCLGRARFSYGNLRDNRKWCILPFVHADFATTLQDSRQNKINTTLQ